MRTWLFGCVATLLVTSSAGFGEPPVPFRTLARMPVKEVTVFKDGHAFVLHSGKMPTTEAGQVVLDYLPTPIMGAFWPFSADRRAKLSAVTASQRKVLVERTALNLRDLIKANVGAPVIVTEAPSGSNQVSYAATIVEVPARSGTEQEGLAPPNSGEKLREDANVVLLRTETGTKVVGFDRIQDIRFTGDYRRTVAEEEFRNLLTLRLEWDGGKPQKDAEVGLLYVQRGLRWIPNYKVTIDGKGQAVVRLQATLVNELTDLEDVTAHLVVGVPTFAFQDIADPMSLQQAVAQLSSNFRSDTRTAYALSNAIMTQQAAPVDAARRTEAEPARALDLGPEVAGSSTTEDLFIFTINHVSLKKSERMVVSVGEFAMKYRDVFALDIPFAPPAELWRNVDTSRRAEIARLFDAAKVQHKIRLLNRSEYPLTTAPALVMRDDRLLAQGLMTYAAPGANTDLTITTAVDIGVKKTDNETRRTPNAAVWQGESYGRIDLAGTITLTSFRKEPVDVEVTRNLVGNVDAADHNAKTEMVNVLEDAAVVGASGPYPSWWNWFAWPWWWHHFNGIGRITWTVTLGPAQPLTLGYTWNYFWR